MDSDQIAVDEIVSDSCLDLDPEECSGQSPSWMDQMEERNRVWSDVAQRITAERSGRVLPTAYMPVEVRVQVPDQKSEETNQLKPEKSISLTICTSPVAGHSRANLQPPARKSRGRGCDGPGYGRRGPERVFQPPARDSRGRGCGGPDHGRRVPERALHPRRWARSQGWKNGSIVGGDRSVPNVQRPFSTVSPYNYQEMPHGNMGGPLRPNDQGKHPGGQTNQRQRPGELMGGPLKRSLGHWEPSKGASVGPAKRPRGDSVCPVRGCDEPLSSRHVFRSHIPQVMDMRVPLSESITRRRLAFLMALGSRVVREGTSLGDLTRFSLHMGYVPQGGGEHSSQVEAVQAISRLTGEEVGTFHNLLHWSVLGRLWALLTTSEQDFFVDTYPLTSDEQKSRWPEATDSHCHLDRWCVKVGMTLDDSIWSHLRDRSPMIEVEVNLGALVTNFCDPHTYPNDALLHTLSELRCFPTIGLHPKGAAKYTDSEIKEFIRLLGRPEVVGFGEVGLDHSVHYSEWLGQAVLLQRVLEYLEERHVLVLHCRGSTHDMDGREVNMRLLSILHGVINRDQRIYLHCFRGDMEVFRAFTDAFPNTYVGYTHKTGDLTPGSLLALRTIPTERLLIETDAPYFSGPNMGPISSPTVVGLAARNVGMVRGESVNDILTATVANFQRLYRLNW
ncbi:hypothetical protein DPMN_081621 [Dreissena polymorpha]|uniref:Uncharacterized protein n=1 Tax=Dreissena polymorpha TaxID=45954 RepID=A0A9D3Y6N3_DREPO|nr:hypothetical protein DPMN_081621 [Dreissena polymorpha]